MQKKSLMEIMLLDEMTDKTLNVKNIIELNQIIWTSKQKVFL